MIAQPAVPERRVAWTFVYVAFLGYVFAVTTFRLPIGTASMIAGLFALLVQQEQIRFPAVLGWSVVFLGWCVLGYFRSPFPTEVWGNVILLGKLCLIMLVAANALRSTAQVRFFMIFFLACYALFPVRGAFVNYFSHYTLFGRALWNYTYDNPNDLAALTLLLLSVAAALLTTERAPWIRRCALAGLVLPPGLGVRTARISTCSRRRVIWGSCYSSDCSGLLCACPSARDAWPDWRSPAWPCSSCISSSGSWRSSWLECSAPSPSSPSFICTSCFSGPSRKTSCALCRHSSLSCGTSWRR